MRRAFYLVVLPMTIQCQAHFERTASHVDVPRVLAIVAEPPEAAPGASVSMTALLAWPDRAPGTPEPEWTLCMRRPEVAAYNSVSDACLPPAGEGLRYAGRATTIDVTVPNEACAVFGSEPPPPQGSDPPSRPIDPDMTGGYYQPIRVSAGEALGFGAIRLSCALLHAPAEIARAFRERYVQNRNPVPLAFEVPSTLRRGARAHVRLSFAPESREHYVTYDLHTGALEDRTETLEAQFFATKGAFSSDVSTGELEAPNDFTAPSEPGPVHLWVVLRDDRGGGAYRSAVVDVE
jgi:hypothetical protein